MKFYVLSNELKAAQYFSSKEKYLLTGVNIEAQNGKSPIITATDGRRIITLKSQAVQEPEMSGPCEGCSVTIEVECLNIIQKLFPGAARITITPNERSITVSCQDVEFLKYQHIEFTHKLGRVEGDYPKFRMVIPRKSTKRTPVDSIAINPGLAACLDNVRKALGLSQKGIHLQFIDPHSVTVIKFVGCNYVWAGVMPLRETENVLELWEPDFLELPAESIKSPIAV